MPIADQAYIRTCGNHVTLHKFKEPVPTSSILILNECECDRKHLVVAINSDCRQYLTFIFFQSRKCHRYRVQEESTETPSRMHQDKRRLGEKCLALRSYSGSAGYQNGFSDFSPQFWPAYQAGYHMTPRMCQTSSRTPFVLPSMPFRS